MPGAATFIFDVFKVSNIPLTRKMLGKNKQHGNVQAGFRTMMMFCNSGRTYNGIL